MKWLLLIFLALVLTSTVHSGRPRRRVNRKSYTFKYEKDVNTCRALPKRPPASSIRDLRIDDIKVVGTLGDSIAAALMATEDKARMVGKFKLFYENRGVSFSSGGDPNATTIPNLINHFNHKVVGSSNGTHFFMPSYGIFQPFKNMYAPGDNLNAAKSGAMAMNLMAEVQYLVRQIKADPAIDLAKDWKLVTIQIGSNDLCVGCGYLGRHGLSPERYEFYLRQALDELRKQIPRLLVNIIGVFKLSGLETLMKGERECSPIRRMMCFCAFAPFIGAKTRASMDRLAEGYNNAILNIRATYPQTDDFAVIVDPSTMGINLAEFPTRAISKIDCFHPTVETHGALAVSIFNNLHLPFAKRPHTMDLAHDLKVPVRCPGSKERIRID